MSAAVEAFTAEDGNGWYDRNKEALEMAVDRDWVLRLIARNNLQPKRVLEGGCASGWRLAELMRRYRCECTGIDISGAAIDAGWSHWPDVRLFPVSIGETPWFQTLYDLVIVSFVLHWVSRAELLQVLANIDRALLPGGYLALQDFDPPEPIDVPYHHRPGVWTYKRDYSAPFREIGYTVVDSRHWNYATGEGVADYPDAERAVCWLLRKPEAG